MYRIERVRDIVLPNETKAFTIFDTHTKYTTQLDYNMTATEVLEKYGSEYVVTCDEYEKGVDIFI